MDHLFANLEKNDCHLLSIEYVLKKHPLNVEIISVPTASSNQLSDTIFWLLMRSVQTPLECHNKT